MKIEVISKDKLFVQKIKEKFSEFCTLQNVLFVVHRKCEDVHIDSLMDDNIHAVFIDVDYVHDAIAFAASIKNAHPSMHIVFVGSSSQDSYKYFEVEHDGYILKSDCDRYLEFIGNRIIQKVDRFNLNFIKIRWKNTVYVVENCDILYIERDKRKTLIHTVYGEVYTTYQHIDEFAQDLTKGFLRIHFSYFVNTSYVKEFHRNHLLRTNDTFVPISRKYAKEIKEYYAGTDMF